MAKFFTSSNGISTLQNITMPGDVFRVVTLTDASTVTPNLNTTDMGVLNSLSQNTTIANATGTPVDGQLLVLRVKSSTSRTLTFESMYRGSTDLALPSATTGSSKTDYLVFRYNSSDSTLDYLGKNFGF